MLNDFGNRDNGLILSKYPVGPRNPPNAIPSDSADPEFTMNLLDLISRPSVPAPWAEGAISPGMTLISARGC
jgi:hypothetical protein